MKILFVTSRFPFPLEKGDKLRSYHFLKELSRHCDVTLVSLSEKKIRKDHIEEIRNIIKTVYVFRLPLLTRYFNTFMSLFMKRPLQAGYFFSRKARKNIHKIITDTKPDHVICQLLRTALYSSELGISKLIDFQDVFSYGVRRRLAVTKFPMNIVLMIEYKKLISFEKKMFLKFNHSMIISDADRELMPVAEKNKIHIVSNGVDHEYFNPDLFQNTTKKWDLLFTGNLGYPPNVDCAVFLAKKVLPLIREKYPEIRLVLAGASPHGVVQKLASENVIVTGWVNDMREWYAGSRFFVAPMQIGTGLQNKLLEAMSMGLPCVTSTLANESLDAKPEKDVLIADTPEDVASQIFRLMEENTLAESLSRNGKQFVRNQFSWQVQAAKILQILTDQ